MTTEMTRYKIIGKLPKIRNKYVKAVLVTKDNKEELEKEFPAVALFNKSAQVYIVLKNPTQTVNKQEFMFVPKKKFEMNAKETYKNTNMPIFKNVSRKEGDRLEAKYGAIVIDNTEEYLARNKKKYVVFTDTRCPGKAFMEGHDYFQHNRVDFFKVQCVTENKNHAIKKVHEIEAEYLANTMTKMSIAEVEDTIKEIKDSQDKVEIIKEEINAVMDFKEVLNDKIAKLDERIASLKESIGVK